jgi:hypothetical protein
VNDKIENGAGAPSRRSARPVRPEGGPSPRRRSPFRHLAHVPSFRANPIVFFTTCTYRRRKILALPKCETILRETWKDSADHDGWYVGHYILMRTTCICLRNLKLTRDRRLIGCTCGKVLVLDVSPRRFLSIRLSGNRNTSIDICDRLKTTRRNGTTLSKTQFALDLSKPFRRGRIVEQSTI